MDNPTCTKNILDYLLPTDYGSHCTKRLEKEAMRMYREYSLKKTMRRLGCMREAVRRAKEKFVDPNNNECLQRINQVELFLNVIESTIYPMIIQAIRSRLYFSDLMSLKNNFKLAFLYVTGLLSGLLSTPSEPLTPQSIENIEQARRSGVLQIPQATRDILETYELTANEEENQSKIMRLISFFRQYAQDVYEQPFRNFFPYIHDSAFTRFVQSDLPDVTREYVYDPEESDTSASQNEGSLNDNNSQTSNTLGVESLTLNTPPQRQEITYNSDTSIDDSISDASSVGSQTSQASNYSEASDDSNVSNISDVESTVSYTSNVSG